MKYLNLPDLGEGLTEAEICEWFVAPGDAVKTDQLLVSVETAKAIVEIPSPCTATVAAIFGAPGDMLHVGEPLVEFAGFHEDAGTVVGKIELTQNSAPMDHFVVGSPHARASKTAQATPAVRALAERLGVRLGEMPVSEGNRLISAREVERAHIFNEAHGHAEPLRGVRRTMARNMAKAHAEVMPVTLFDDVDIHDWPEEEDITARLASAIGVACMAEPSLNAWFDGLAETRRLLPKVDLGIAVNTEDGLFVPVLRNVARRSIADLRTGIDRLREDVQNRSIPPAEMIGATITLSNFGVLGGRYGTPVVVPPTVAILGAGVIRMQPAVHEEQLQVRRLLPLSLSFDHRAVTGAEAARFLGALMQALNTSTPES